MAALDTHRVPILVAAAAALFRVPFLQVLPSPDEAGLLVVAGQWHHGNSLYGDYWVDRPPLLITLAELADATGGLGTLRLLGLLATVITVLLCAATAGRLAGARAAGWAAVAAGVLMVSPWLGADRVNAELLATPWLASGVYAGVRAVESPTRFRWALLAGASVTAAVATKQNLVDAAVFLLVLVLASVATGSLPARAALRLGALATAGAATVTVVLLGWAWSRGTVPTDLFDALYAFRVRAAETMAAWPSPGTDDRRDELLQRTAVSGQLALVAVVLLAPLARRFRSPSSIALAATVAYAVVSVGAGGSWWNHYLVQFAVPVSIGSGLIGTRTRGVVPLVLTYATAAAVAGALLVGPALRTVDAPIAAGRMIGSVAQPGDTIVHAWGRPDLVWASGLTSPYEQLWSLPVRTDDPSLVRFRRVLGGADAPTWLVTRGSLRAPGLATSRATSLVGRRYRPVGQVCRLTILLRRDVRRAMPDVPRSVDCRPPTHLR